MAFRDYLHEKAEESRHNETLAYLLFLIGAVFFVGGVLETLSLAQAPEWFVFFPYHADPIPGSVLGLALTVSGCILVVFGLASGISRSRDRSWYMRELRKATSIEEKTIEGETRPKRPRKRPKKIAQAKA